VTKTCLSLWTKPIHHKPIHSITTISQKTTHISILDTCKSKIPKLDSYRVLNKWGTLISKLVRNRKSFNNSNHSTSSWTRKREFWIMDIEVASWMLIIPINRILVCIKTSSKRSRRKNNLRINRSRSKETSSPNTDLAILRLKWWIAPKCKTSRSKVFHVIDCRWVSE